jgi:hypothetical protein
MDMHEFRPAKSGLQMQRVCPQYFERDGRGAHFSEQRAAVVCCPKIPVLPPTELMAIAGGCAGELNAYR